MPQAQTQSSTTPHPAFRLLNAQSVESLNLIVEEYEHIQTGAQHIHLAADNPENVFLVALRTVPEDSTGVAHILEHTALCGSERYPVRDPFFMMTRRSLNTFMNAFTSSDWTAYPFASVNRKDFNNLLDVYLDAVFFSRLDPLDFAQEGHRLEFATPSDPASELQYKGVVFNEMKGAMSSVNSQLWQTLTKYLFPTNTYHHNSGGEPSCIPDLTYDQLVNFYKTHYHPSNAIFMTYGDISAAEHQRKFETQALQRFERLDKTIFVADEKRYNAPIRVEEHYPLAEEDLAQKTHIVMGWLLGKSTDLEEALTAHLLSSLLLDNSASPLMHALETTELGQAPSPLCGLDDSQKEVLLVCGIAGSERQQADQIEALVLNTLKKVAEEGIPHEDIEAALHQLELQQREVGGDGYPYGLQLILNGLTAATHRGDPVALLNIDDALARLREKIKDAQFIPNLIQEWLLNNPHRVQLTLTPSRSLSETKEQAEREQLAKIQSALNNKEKAAIVEQAEALLARQAQVDDDSILPKVTLEDVPAQEKVQSPLVTETLPQNKAPLYGYAAGTNGLVYQQLVCELPDLSDEELVSLPFYSTLLTEVGIGEKNYLDVQRWQARVCGSINAFSSMRGSVDDSQTLNNFFTLSGKSLVNNHTALCDLMQETFSNARFDESARLGELVAQIRSHKEQSVTGSGHSLAMQAAAKGISTGAYLSFHLGGLESIRRIKNLDDSLSDSQSMERFQASLQSIHRKLQQTPKHYLIVGEEQLLENQHKTFSKAFDSTCDTRQFSPLASPFTAHKTQEAWLTNAQVNFCAKAYPTVASNHPDAAALIVLGNVMRNGFLHRTIREQGGAYGGGASQDNSSGAFHFYSYRDPRTQETLNDFDNAIDWAITTHHSAQSIEEAILGVVSGLDKPDSPAGAAKRDFHAMLNERTPETRQRFRERLLAVNEEKLKEVAGKYLKKDHAHTCIITDRNKAEAMKEAGLNIETL